MRGCLVWYKELGQNKQTSKQRDDFEKMATTTPYTKCKHVKLFNDTLVKFFDELRHAVPAMKQGVKRAYKFYCSCPRKQYIQTLMKNLSPHMALVNQKDLGLFSTDYPFVKDLANVFQVPDDLDISAVPASAQKPTILHLRALYACAGLALQQIGVFDESMDLQRQIFSDMVDEAQLEPEIKEKMEELIKQREEDEADGDWLNPEKIKEMFGADTVITELIVDFLQELGDLVDPNDPFAKQKMAAKVISGKLKMKKLFNRMIDKIRDKLANGEITREELLAQAQHAQEKVIEQDSSGLAQIIVDKTRTQMQAAIVTDEDEESAADASTGDTKA
jgi:polyhydroxyalkanoate synthesis regulator phasin